MAAMTMDSDMDFASWLQFRKGINASLSPHHSASSSSTLPAPLPPPVSNNDVSGALSPGVQLEEVQKFDQEIKGDLISQEEFRKMREDFHRRLHDQKLAEEIQRMPEDKSEGNRGNCQRRRREGSSKSSITNETFRIYFKGMAKKIQVPDEKRRGTSITKVCVGIGVAITDSRDHLIFEFRKPLCFDGMSSVEGTSKRIVGIKALIDGLNAALVLGLSRVAIYCDSFPIFQFVSSHPFYIYTHANIMLCLYVFMVGN